MKTSNKIEQNINDKKRELADAEERRRRVQEAQLRIEEQRLRLENNVKKLNEAAAQKQKTSLDKKKKEDLANQRKDLKSEGQARTNPTEDRKGIENKYSLSNLDDKEQTPSGKQGSNKSIEEARPHTVSEYSLTGSRTFQREKETTPRDKQFEKKSSFEMDYKQERIPSRSRELHEERNFDPYGYKMDKNNVNNLGKKFERSESPLESWEKQKESADRLKEEELDMYRTELKSIKESLKNFDSNFSLGRIENNSSVKKQNLMKESFQEKEDFPIPSAGANLKEFPEPSSSKGFQRRPLSRQEQEYQEPLRNEGQRTYDKEQINKIIQNPIYNVEEITRKPVDYNPYQQSVKESHYPVSEKKLKSEPPQEEMQRSSGRGAFEEKTKLQLELSSKIKQLQLEKEKERKKNEEAALKAKQQILSQLKNKNQESCRPPVLRKEKEEQLNTINYSARTDERRQVPEQNLAFSNRVQRGEYQEQEIVPQYNQPNRSNLRESSNQIRPQSSYAQEKEEKPWQRGKKEETESENEDEDEGQKSEREQEEESQESEREQEDDDQQRQDESEEEENQEENDEQYDIEEDFEPEEIEEDQEEFQESVKQKSNYEPRTHYQNSNNQHRDDVRESKSSLQKSNKYDHFSQYQEEPKEEENLTYAQLHARNRQSMNQNPTYEPKHEDPIPKNIRNYEKNYQETQKSYNNKSYHEEKRKGQDPQKEQSPFGNQATFGRKEFGGKNNYERSDRYESNNSYEEQLEKIKVRENDSEEEPEDEKPRSRERENESDNENQEKTSHFGKYQFLGSITSEPNYKKVPEPQFDNKRDTFGKQSFKNQEQIQENRRSKDESALRQSSKIEKMPSRQRGWEKEKHSEETSEEEKENTASQRFRAEQEDFKTANFGYKDTNKPTRVRKGWGQPPPKSQSESVEETPRSDPQLKDHSEENEEDEEEMLQSYKQKRSQNHQPEEREKPEEKHEQDEKHENVVLVFDDNKDKEKKQRQYENMMKRLEKNKGKEKRDKSIGGRHNYEKEAHEAISDNEGYHEETPKQVLMKSKRIVSAQVKPTTQKTSETPTNNKPVIPKPSFVKEKPEKFESYEEIKSVEPSAKSNKSVAKSPGGPNNNIFQTPKTGGQGGGHKKSAIEFSKQSNRLIIKNAITNVCLAGELNRKEREEVVAKINEVKADMNFIIVFKAISGRQDFKALYVYDSAGEEIRKLYSNGTAPAFLDANVVENYYRYNSGSKEFKPIQGNKNFSLAVDAVSLQPQVFKKVPNDKLY